VIVKLILHVYAVFVYFKLIDRFLLIVILSCLCCIAALQHFNLR